jgi:hypothetical protein
MVTPPHSRSAPISRGFQPGSLVASTNHSQLPATTQGSAQPSRSAAFAFTVS